MKQLLTSRKKKEQMSSTDSENDISSKSRSGRKRKNPRNEDFTDADDDCGSLFNKPPKLTKGNRESSTSTSSTVSLDEDYLMMPPPPPVTYSPRVIRSDVIPTDSETIASDTNCNQNNNCEVGLENSGNNISGCCCNHGKTLKDILENSIAIRTILNEHQRIMENHGSIVQKAAENFDTLPKKPFVLMKKLIKYEDILKNSEDAKKQLENVFFMIGGNARESVRRGLAKIFSNKCSYHGRKQNYPIKDLICINILKGALRRRFGNSVSDKEFENLVAQWLKQAELRFKREKENTT